MDRFLFWHNQLTLLAQGVLQFAFLLYLSGRNWKLSYFLIFLPVFYAGGILTAPNQLLSLGWDGLVLYGAGLLLRNGPLTALVISVLAVSLGQLSFGILYPIQTVFFPGIIRQQNMLCLLLTLSVLLSLFCCGLLYWFVARSVILQQDYKTISCQNLLLPPVLFFCLTETYLLQTYYSNAITVCDTGRQIALEVVQLSGLAALVCIFFFYRFLYQAQRTQEALRLRIQAQHDYVEQARQKQAHTRGFRHDLRNHLTVLDGLLQTGKPEQAQQYLQQLRVSAATLSFPVHTGSPAVDMILSDKLALASQKKIACSCSLLLPSFCWDKMDETALCAVFANALDNAIQACAACRGSKQITVSGQQQGNFYLIVFENTCASPEPYTTGTGLSNIRAVARRYGGTVSVRQTAERFRLCILLNCSIHPKDHSIQNACGSLREDYNQNYQNFQEGLQMNAVSRAGYTPAMQYADQKPSAQPEKSENPDKPEPVRRENRDRYVPKEKDSETMTVNTDRVDAEIRKLKQQKEQLKQQIACSAHDPARVQQLEQQLARLEQELQAKDTDSYRRQHAVVTKSPDASSQCRG